MHLKKRDITVCPLIERRRTSKRTYSISLTGGPQAKREKGRRDTEPYSGDRVWMGGPPPGAAIRGAACVMLSNVL